MKQDVTQKNTFIAEQEEISTISICQPFLFAGRITGLVLY
jgi:hypothetical protein